MLRSVVLLVAASATVVVGVSLTPGTVGNTLIVKFGVPGRAFYTLPRTQDEASKASYEKAADRAEDRTTVWCPKDDYRVCLLFDAKGSVAGIQISVPVKEIQDSKVPLTLENVPEWLSQTVLGVQVYSLVIFFVPKAALLTGGRTLTASTLTAPDGLYFLQTDSNGVETNRLHVGNAESAATATGFVKQACFVGMGKHYYQALTKTTTCEAYRPYFVLFSPKTQNLTGFGFNMYGKPNTGKWIETSSAFTHKFIAPDEPTCQAEWIKKYGLFALHVYFIERPYLTLC